MNSRRAAEDFIAKQHLQGHAKYYSTQKNGKTLYKVVYGHYTSKQSAKEAIAALPENLRQLKPWVRSRTAIATEQHIKKIARAAPTQSKSSSLTKPRKLKQHAAITMNNPSAAKLQPLHAKLADDDLIIIANDDNDIFV